MAFVCTSYELKSSVVVFDKMYVFLHSNKTVSFAMSRVYIYIYIYNQMTAHKNDGIGERSVFFWKFVGNNMIQLMILLTTTFD